jgi:hypothetical protein
MGFVCNKAIMHIEAASKEAINVNLFEQREVGTT